MDDITKRRIEARKRALLAHAEILKDASALVMAGAPVDLDWWIRQLEEAHSKLDALAAVVPSRCEASIQRIRTELDNTGLRAAAIALYERAGTVSAGQGSDS